MFSSQILYPFSIFILVLTPLIKPSLSQQAPEKVGALSSEEQQLILLAQEQEEEFSLSSFSTEEQQLILLVQEQEEEFSLQSYPAVIGAAENVEVSVHLLPNNNAIILTTVGNGTNLDILCQTTGDTVKGFYGTSDIWSLVRFPNMQGYVPNSFIQAPQQRFVTSNCLAGRTTITIKPATKIDFVYNDAGTGADNDISVWRADLSKDPGFYSLGDVGMSFHWPPPGTIFIISAQEDELQPPTDYIEVWNDAGSGGDMDVAFWQPVAPSGYTCLGNVAQVGYDKPSTDLIRCVKDSLVRVGSPQWLWDDKGSGADRDISVWEVVPSSNDLRGSVLNLFVSLGYYDNPGTDYWVLDRDAINGGPLGRHNIDIQTPSIFAPKIFLHPDEYYFPGSPSIFLQNVHAENGFLVTNEPLGCDSCTNPTFLDGMRPDQNEVPVYANIVQRIINNQPTSTVDIIYWTFYPYNNGKRVCIGLYTVLGCIGGYSTFGNHVGDWEHTIVRFVDGYATKTYCSSHGSGQELNWGDKRINMTQSNNYIVFAAKGSHGFYFDENRHTFEELFNGDTLDDDTGFGAEWDTWKTLVPFYWQTPGTYSGPVEFMNIQERWGNPASGCDNIISEKTNECVLNPGPKGPMLKDISDPTKGLNLD